MKKKSTFIVAHQLPVRFSGLMCLIPKVNLNAWKCRGECPTWTGLCSGSKPFGVNCDGSEFAKRP